MLGEILQTLKSHKGEELDEVPNKVPNKLKVEFPDISDSTWNVYIILPKIRPVVSLLS